jgi:hypothetical protein
VIAPGGMPLYASYWMIEEQVRGRGSTTTAASRASTTPTSRGATRAISSTRCPIPCPGRTGTGIRGGLPRSRARGALRLRRHLEGRAGAAADARQQPLCKGHGLHLRGGAAATGPSSPDGSKRSRPCCRRRSIPGVELGNAYLRLGNRAGGDRSVPPAARPGEGAARCADPRTARDAGRSRRRRVRMQPKVEPMRNPWLE